MYVHRILIQQIIKLFVEQPEYRDDHFGTIEYITRKYYIGEYGKSIKADFKLLADISRGFRFIQQFEPKYRGKTWLSRQRQAGEITRDEYEKCHEIKETIKQLKLNLL